MSSFIQGGGPPVAGQLWLSAAGAWPSTTSGCKTNALVETPTNKANIYVLDFVDGSQTFAEASVLMPSDYDGGTITARFAWFTQTDATTNAVVWGLAGRAFGDGDALDQAFGTAQSVTDANGGSALNERISGLTAAITLAGTPAASKYVQLRFFRDGAAGGDTLTADARLQGVMVGFTRS